MNNEQVCGFRNYPTAQVALILENDMSGANFLRNSMAQVVGEDKAAGLAVMLKAYFEKRHEIVMARTVMKEYDMQVLMAWARYGFEQVDWEELAAHFLAG